MSFLPPFRRRSQSKDRLVTIRVGEDAYHLELGEAGLSLASRDDAGSNPMASVLELYPWGFAVTAPSRPDLTGNARRQLDLVVSQPVDKDRTMYVFETKQAGGASGKDRSSAVDVGTIEGASIALTRNDGTAW